MHIHMEENSAAASRRSPLTPHVPSSAVSRGPSFLISLDSAAYSSASPEYLLVFLGGATSLAPPLLVLDVRSDAACYCIVVLG